MPELPEVETILRDLSPVLRGQTIIKADFFYPRMLHASTPQNFTKLLRHQSFGTPRRRGKYLIFTLTGSQVLLVHLGMTGKLILNGQSQRHTIFKILLENQESLSFVDPRKFGRVWLTESVEQILSHLGSEPLEANFDWKTLAQNLHSGRKIKALLLDQSKIAGIGNIYADEALFRSGILPTRLGNSLRTKEIIKLHQKLIAVLQEGIEHRGSSIRDYADARGIIGQQQLFLQAYGRAGQPCLKCKTKLLKTIVAGRGTSYCPRCQK